MEDRELLEFAAKAAEIELPRWSEIQPKFNLNLLLQHWNPLADDGDAFRLAVKLKMQVKVFDKVASAVWEDDSGWYSIEFKYTDSPYAATRRAIVRAAAEIGRAM